MTVEKPNENFIIPKLESLEMLPLENKSTFQPSNFFVVEEEQIPPKTDYFLTETVQNPRS